MSEGATGAVEQVICPTAMPTGTPERKSLWERLKALWWLSGFGSAVALVHFLDELGFSRDWLRFFHAVSTRWEFLMKGLGDWLYAVAPFPIDLRPAELTMMTIYSGVLIPAAVPWIKGDELDFRAMERLSPKLAKLSRGLAPGVAILGVGMLGVSMLAFCSAGDSVSAKPDLVDPTANLPDGWREFGRFYVFAAALMMIAIWNRSYFRVLVVVAGFLIMLEAFYHVPILDAAMHPLLDWIDPAGSLAAEPHA